MSLIGLLIVIFILCLLLWIVNASGWMPMPPPIVWGFNVVVLIIFLFSQRFLVTGMTAGGTKE